MPVRVKWLTILFVFVCCFSRAQTTADAKQQFAEFDQCPLVSGDKIQDCKIGYRTFGQLNAAKDNAILVPTWYTGSSEDHQYLVTDGVLDPSKYFIVIVDALANGISSSPSNSKVQPLEKFPVITIADMVDSQHKLLTNVLGVNQLYAVVGLSMGGMQAFEWAVRYPAFTQKIVSAIGSPQLPSFDIALWTTQINLMTLFRNCQCQQAISALTSMRYIGMVPEVLGTRIPRDEIIQTITEQAQQSTLTIANTWDYQRQAQAMITHDIARAAQHDLSKVAALIKARFLIVLGADDRVVTPHPARAFAPMIKAKLVELDADCGHGDPWCAKEEFTLQVSRFLDEK
ncbi:alpha/beta fold hydrolase [Aliiglaciecola litoralis]|uniref:Alpha/beta fold hydrolase n=1 Tax=Aliiglaciecola litoralis TaxID=582857 RepID=A0ABN1LHT4_9ALTE